MGLVKLRLISAVLSFTFLFGIQFSNAQVVTRTYRNGIPNNVLPVSKLIEKQLLLDPPAGFRDRMNKQDNNPDEQAVTAAVLHTNIDFLTNSGQMIDGERITYTLKITAKEAGGIKLAFSSFFLSPNARLTIFTENELTEDITSKENNRIGRWATRLYGSNTINIVLTVPYTEKGQSKIVISKVCFGYIKTLENRGHPGNAANCTVNANCPAGNSWGNEKNSVALVERIEGSDHFDFSAVLIMNACGTKVPYVLTADHNLDAGDVSDWVFVFKFWSTDCNTTTGYSDDIAFFGGILRANYFATDFALVEMFQTPADVYGLHYAGWSRNTTGIQNATILHHPKGDVMKISVDNSAPSQYTYINTSAGWNITGWLATIDQIGGNDAATEKGSSGGPYFDQDHRIIGQHFGSPDVLLGTCLSRQKLAGRFDLSWAGGGTNATRLSNWLDPTGSNVMTTNTTSSTNLISVSPLNYDITGPTQFCISGVYTIPGLPAGATVQWNTNAPGAVGFSVTGGVLTLTRTLGDLSLVIDATISYCGYSVVKYYYVRVGGDPITIIPTETGCNEVSFTVNGAQTGAAYNWTSAGNTILYNGTSTTAITTSNQISAVITSGNGDDVQLQTTNTCSQPVSLSLQYSPFQRVINGLYPEYVLCGDHISVSVNTTQYDTYYRWYINGNIVIEGAYADSYCTCYYNGPTYLQGGQNTIMVEVETSCGLTAVRQEEFFWGCGYFKTSPKVSLHPNPAVNQITIKLDELNKSNGSGAITGIREVKIFDKLGTIRMTSKYPVNAHVVILDISKLPADIYYVEISDNKSRTVLSFAKVK